MIPHFEAIQHINVMSRKCASHVQTRAVAGTGPHSKRLECVRCGSFIGWASDRTPQEREAIATKRREARMVRQAPTEKQIDYLRALGDTGLAPVNKFEASKRIEFLLIGRAGR
jgi:hypothetical protein